MATIITTSTRHSCSIHRIYFAHIVPSARLALFPGSLAAAAVKCSNNGSAASDEGSLKDILSGIVDERVEQLLNKEENKALLKGLEQASTRVEIAKRQLAEIQKQEMEAKNVREYINQLESRASEIEECQKEILEARAMVDEAELSLKGAGGDASSEMESGMSSKDEERLQSVKAASISALIGTLAELPISLSRVTSNSQLILPLAITFVSCALFGVTFRYAIRRDLDNFQLKSGTSAAFGFVKGLAMLEAGLPLELDSGSILSHAFDGAVYVSESLLIFLFAGVALDFCIKLRILSPFPIERSAPRT
ncbi:homer protein [Perilla frutescens var. hirtella]|uniref:Homer protein n=1 Tax=Perilla frutescens var. hirtella TaxID=608512 RepID=A0AAD4IN98_PERFH|nr:homer protein [Perilla frutescens var. hirtella]